MKKYIRSNTYNLSQCSIDFAHDGSYDENVIYDILDAEISAAGGQVESNADFHSVDYDIYPEYGGKSVSQVTIDFSHDGSYDETTLTDRLVEQFDDYGYELAAIDFYSLTM